MKHKHHIIPKHLGGSNDPSNLVELTVQDHAEAHYKLFQEYGRWQDELAWKGLSGQISTQELIRESQRLANLGRIRTQEERDKISRNNGMRRPEIAAKTSAKMIGNKNSLGHRNAAGNKGGEGKQWINNSIVEKRNPRGQEIPEGFIKGRLKPHCLFDLRSKLNT